MLRVEIHGLGAQAEQVRVHSGDLGGMVTSEAESLLPVAAFKVLEDATVFSRSLYSKVSSLRIITSFSS